MDWTQAIAIILSTLGMMLATIIFIVSELRQISRDINNEMRDFHGRLCTLEERYLKGRK
jgi:1,4-dihydroxy-2-naphthoate octaprenyltransferase